MSGIFPERKLLSNSITVRFVNFPISDGIEPVNWFSFRTMISKLFGMLVI